MRQLSRFFAAVACLAYGNWAKWQFSPSKVQGRTKMLRAAIWIAVPEILMFKNYNIKSGTKKQIWRKNLTINCAVNFATWNNSLDLILLYNSSLGDVAVTKLKCELGTGAVAYQKHLRETIHAIGLKKTVLSLRVCRGGENASITVFAAKRLV